MLAMLGVACVRRSVPPAMLSTQACYSDTLQSNQNEGRLTSLFLDLTTSLQLPTMSNEQQNISCFKSISMYYLGENHAKSRKE
jgi:hypothetical protein